jgi:peptide deformylase
MKNIEKILKEQYPIQTGINNPILRKKSEKVQEITKEIQEFSEILHTGMEIYDGIWLAAPQIWVNKRMIAVCQLNKKEDKVISSQILINPKIIEKSNKTFLQEEWCLSLPGLEWEVERHFKVKVIYQDINWKKHEMNATWLNAAILQHEIDHLDWILFWDKVVKKQWPNLKKLLNL